MIVVQAPGPVEERFIREALAPLGQNLTSSSGEGEVAALAILWDPPPQTAVVAARSILLITSEREDHALAPDMQLTLPVRGGEIADKARTLLARDAVDALPLLLSIGPYEFRPRENAVHHKNTKVILRLTDKERDILLTLHKAGGQPVSRQALLDAVWAYAPDVETHTLETHIYRLRQKIETDPAAPSIVLTDEQGYRILPA